MARVDAAQRRRALRPLLAAAALLATLVLFGPRAPGEDVAASNLLGRVDGIVGEVTAARGIRLAGTFERRLVGRAEARAALEAGLRAEQVPGLADPRILQQLGLLPGRSSAESLTAAMSRQAGALYDPGSRTLMVPSWLSFDQQRPSLVHAVCHAVQDARFGLEAFARGSGNERLETDALLARQALVEGDAAALTLEVLDPNASIPGARELAGIAETMRAGLSVPKGAPAIVRETLAFTQVDGFRFVMRLRARQSWAALDAVWSHPPRSTAQILHPERFDRDEAPASVDPGPLGEAEARHSAASSDVLGELVARVWLERATSAELAARMADGWRGDRAVLFVPRPGAAGDVPTTDAGATDSGSTESAAGAFVAWLTVWDSDGDAEDFHTGAVQVLSRAARGEARPVGDALVFRHGAELAAIARRADRVAVIAGGPEASSAGVQAMLTGWQVTGAETRAAPATVAPRPSPGAAAKPAAGLKPAARPRRR